MRVAGVSFPQDEKTFDIERQFMAGGDLMVVPVTKQGATSTSVYFPGTEVWYGAFGGTKYTAPSEATVDAPITAIPVFQRGGSIVPRQMRLRRSSASMADDPFTLVVAPAAARTASGRLYLDPGDSYGYRKGEYAYWKFEWTAEGVLRAKPVHTSAAYVPRNMLERLELLDTSLPASVTLTTADGATRPLTFAHIAATNRLVVRKPDVPIASEWTVTIVY